MQQANTKMVHICDINNRTIPQEKLKDKHTQYSVNERAIGWLVYQYYTFSMVGGVAQW